MKKTMKAITAIALSSLVLSGCNPTPKAPKENIAPSPAPPSQSTDTRRGGDNEYTKRHERDGIEHILGKLPISGVLRRFKPDLYGVYTVEYIHSPRDTERDETLDYRLELKDDNTFDLNVTSNGVQAEHYGHWYMHRGGNIMLYYDEPIDPTAHNVYVSDTLYGDMLDGGKIMIYENCNVIVLSREWSDAETHPPVADDNDVDGNTTVPQTFLSQACR